ncbi:Nitroreductase [Cystobacter fuscus DSM 2262]|uniref:Nitroreductase n=1 Tax=Cystobacter fuscus (strain ATCC 25194 / DSM 2262 / NBRC 100088 / M29) TaxID=1242864 RepID=S9QYG2_CYSF2|nr:Nitroreductase [Cystobacter fuscus DSM 2262]
MLSALERRRSTRTFGNTPLAQHELMTLLWATYGGLESGRRTVPSSGSVYPLRLRVVVRAVEGLAPQVYAFDHHNGELTPEPEVPAPMELQTWYVTRHVNFDGSAALVVMIGDLSRIAAVYGERGYRFLHLEAGHAGQNLCLAASLLDVPHVALGGFDDDVVNRAFHLEGSDSFVVYSVLLGCHQG